MTTEPDASKPDGTPDAAAGPSDTTDPTPEPPPASGWAQVGAGKPLFPPRAPDPAATAPTPGWGAAPPDPAAPPTDATASAPPPPGPPTTWAPPPEPVPTTWGAASDPAAAPPSAGPTAPPGGWVQAPPPAAPAARGCAFASVGCLALIAVAAVVGLGFLWWASNNLLGGLPIDGGDGALADCSFLGDDEAREVLGGNADATPLEGLFETTLGLVLDTRVLADAPDCFVQDGERATLARVALYQGGDAEAVFDAERTKAEPSSVDQGGGVTLEDPGYFGGDVGGLGDEAFCTGVDTAIMAGVLVRQGDRVVYATVGPSQAGGEVQPPDLGIGGEVIVAPEQCALAQELARAVLD